MRLYLVIDTNILLTHLAVLERLREQRRPPDKPVGSDALEDPELDFDVVVVVPWIVLYELDRIKADRPNDKGASATSCTPRFGKIGISANICRSEDGPCRNTLIAGL